MFQGLYINLDRSHGRRQHMEAELQRFGLSAHYRRLRAVPNVVGTKGCFQSHLLAWDFARRQDRLVHVIEDDGIFSAGVGPFLSSQEITDYLDKYDMVYLDMWVDPDETTVRRYQKAMRTPGLMDLRDTRIGCVSSYVVSPRSARKLLKLLRRSYAPIDDRITELVQAGAINAAVMVPFLTGVDIEVGSHSQIQKISSEEQRRYVMMRTAFFVDQSRQPAFHPPA